MIGWIGLGMMILGTAGMIWVWSMVIERGSWRRENKVLAVDFDGTLFRSKWPGIGKPKRLTIWMVKRRKRMGDTLILDTCREGKLFDEALAACAARGLYFDYANENTPERIVQYGGDCRKISADEYWDDKARRIF